MAIEFSLEISNEFTTNPEYYLTVNQDGSFSDKVFNSASAVREWLKNEFNLTQEQIDTLFDKTINNDMLTVLNEENDYGLDIDEQMHEMQERDAEYAELYAEWVENCL